MSDYPADIIVSSRKIKELFLERCATLGVSVEAVCHALKIPISDFELWQNAIDPDDALKAMPQFRVIELLDCVFVDLQLVLVAKPVEALAPSQKDAMNEIIESYSSIGFRKS